MDTIATVPMAHIDPRNQSYVQTEENLFQNMTRFLKNGEQTLFQETLKSYPQMALYKVNNTNETLLHYVAKFGSIDSAIYLLNHGADINSQDYQKRTPLYRSLEFKLEMVNFLLNNGADPKIIPLDKTLLQQALNSGSIDIVSLILSKIHKEFEIPENLEIIRKDEKCWKIVEFLLSRQIDLNSPGTEFSLLLFFILRNGEEEIFRQTLENQSTFNLNGKCPFGHTILHWAIQLDKDSCVKYLLDQGAEINAGGANGMTALHHAVGKKNPSLVFYLLSRGANVNKVTRDEKYSPLHFALVVNNDEIIEMLLAAGADIKAKFGSPLESSSVLNLVCGCTSLRQQLSFPVDNSYDVNSLFWGRNIVFNKERIKFLLEMGADIEVTEESYNGSELTPLQRACEAGRLDIVELLIFYGADIHSRNSDGMTMIHHAVRGMNLKIVQLLLRKGLDINATDNFNRTPIYCLVNHVMLHSDDVIPIIEFLVDNGADVNICNKEEFSSTAGAGPLHMAVKQNRLNVIECLLDLEADVQAQNKFRERPLEASFYYKDFITRRSEILIAFMAMKNIDVNYFDDIDDDDETHEDLDGNRKMAIFYYRKCQIEIEKMKNRRICEERNINFYEFLANDLMKVAISARYRRILEVLDLKKYELEFPCYSFFLKKRIERVKSMLKFQEAVFILLQSEFPENKKFPILIIDRIFQYFSARDFRNVGRIVFR